MLKNILIGVVIVIIIAGGLYYVMVAKQSTVVPVEQKQEGLGSELLNNPGTIVPDANPFEEVDTNPLQGTNPFEGGYKNPFE